MLFAKIQGISVGSWSAMPSRNYIRIGYNPQYNNCCYWTTLPPGSRSTDTRRRTPKRHWRCTSGATAQSPREPRGRQKWVIFKLRPLTNSQKMRIIRAILISYI